MSETISRRALLQHSGMALGAAGYVLSQTDETPAVESAGGNPFRFCLNTSTIRGKELPLPEVVEIAARAGYQGIEPWIREIETYQQAGGSLPDLRKRIADHGLTVESAIGFAEWIVDDDEQRAQGLERAKRDMDLVQQIGGSRIAAPPAGAYNQSELDLLAAAHRYRALVELGETMEMAPQLEFWGSAQSLSRLSQAIFIAVECGHANACLLPDIYHLFRGGSDFGGLNLLNGGAIHVFHMNDYPGNIAREAQKDSDRVYPGDGVAPLRAVLRTLRKNGCRAALSLELFNPEYWKQDPLEVAATGLKKMQQAVMESLS